MANNRREKFIFLICFFCVSVFFCSIAIPICAYERKEDDDNMKTSKEINIFNSIDDLVKKSDLIISGEIKRIEVGSGNTKYLLVWVEEVFKGRCFPCVSIELKVKNDKFNEGDKGIIYLSTKDKSVYWILNHENSFVSLEGINFNEYVTALKNNLSSIPKSAIEEKQDRAVLIAKKKAIELGYNDLPPKKWTQRRVGVSISTSS